MGITERRMIISQSGRSSRHKGYSVMEEACSEVRLRRSIASQMSPFPPANSVVLIRQLKAFLGVLSSFPPGTS